MSTSVPSVVTMTGTGTGTAWSSPSTLPSSNDHSISSISSTLPSTASSTPSTIITSGSTFFTGILIGYSCIYGGYHISRSISLHRIILDVSSTFLIQPWTSLSKQFTLFSRSFFTSASSTSVSSSSTASTLVSPSPSPPVRLDLSTSPPILIETLLSSSREQQVQALRIIHTLSSDPLFQEKCRTYTLLRPNPTDTDNLLHHLCIYLHQCYGNTLTIPLYQLGLEIMADFGADSIHHSTLDRTGIITLCINNLKKALVIPHTLTDVSLGTGALRTLTNIAFSSTTLTDPNRSNRDTGSYLLLYHHSLLVTLLIEALNTIDKNPLRLQCLKLIQILISTDEGVNIFRPLVQSSIFLTNFYGPTTSNGNDSFITRDTVIRNGILNGDELMILELSILSSLSLLQKDIYEYTGNGVHIVFRNGSPERFLPNNSNENDNTNGNTNTNNDTTASSFLDASFDSSFSSPSIPSARNNRINRLSNNTSVNISEGNITPSKRNSNYNSSSSSTLPPSIAFTSASPPGTPSRRLILAKLKEKPVKSNTSSTKNKIR